MNKTTFRVQLVVDYVISETSATRILSDPNPAQALLDYVNSNPASEDDPSTYCVEQVRKAFGAFLADRRIEESRQLCDKQTVDVEEVK